MIPGPDCSRKKNLEIKEPDDDFRQAIELFLYGVIVDPVLPPVGPKATIPRRNWV